MAEVDDLLAAWADRGDDEAAAWAGARPGPPLAAVAARLSSAPRAFLDDRLSIAALAGDVLERRPACIPFADDARVRRGAGLALWLIASEELVEPFAPALGDVVRTRLEIAVDALALRVAPVADPLDWLADAERRDEAARTFLLWAGYLPAGEDAATARDLLAAHDSLQRNEALAAAFAEHRHRAEVARRLAEARAKEAAARYSRE
ncbi:phosphohydrolase [Agromyces sp. MMS24-K17]|uniref:phosphohydrolase n=1 Tax=Agromyces sp. MMS24-K17 TaxID=3372850 RepID=UPI003754B9D3